MKQELNDLDHYLPPGRSEKVLTLLRSKQAILKITKHRKSKFGDYRPPQKGKPHIITINGSLNRYAFFITFLHEYAHLQMFELFKGKIEPHGREWKTAFGLLLSEELSQNTFPSELVPAIRNYSINPKASTFSDVDLYNALRSFDTNTQSVYQLNDLQDGAKFRIGNKYFTRGKLRRTRYLCEEDSSGKMYLVHKNAEVVPL